MIFLCFVLFCAAIPFSACLKEGESCRVSHGDDIPGVCKSIHNCPYAKKLLYENEEKPLTCGFEDDSVRIVCCPATNFERPIYDRMRHSLGRVTRSVNVQNMPDPPLSTEEDCPPLVKPTPPPNLNTAERIAWNKCMDNQQHIKLCVANSTNPEQFIRIDTCPEKPADWQYTFGYQPAREKQFPHMASLGVVGEGAPPDLQWVGSGSLISDRFILTAAHLVHRANRPVQYAMLGYLTRMDPLSGTLYNVIRKIPHPFYTYLNNQHDIALVELHRRVSFSEYVRPACLPVSGLKTPSYIRDIAVWGGTTNPNDAQVLHTTTVIIDDWECAIRISSKFSHYNSSIMICAFAKGEKNAEASEICREDHGDPLMAELDNVHCSYSVEGVVSLGIRCGKGLVGVYTRVSHYLEWIVQNVWPEDWRKATEPSDCYIRAVLKEKTLIFTIYRL